jgi:opacity protein-like surface antigen
MSPRSLFAAVLLLLFSFAASAAEHSQRVSGFVVNPGTDRTGSAGLMYSYGWTPRWSAEISAAQQQNRAYLQLRYRFPVPNPQIIFFERRLNSYPTSARIVYRAENGSRLTPIFGAGVHHVNTPQFSGPLREIPRIPGAPISEDDFVERISAEVMAGFEWRLTDRLGVRASLERLLRNDEVVYDRATKGALALSWRLR